MPFASWLRRSRPNVEDSLSPNEQRLLKASRRVARLMDAQWRLGPVRVGLETVTDLVPVLGDVCSLGVSLYQLGVAQRLGVPRGKRVRMGINVGVDALAGSIPVVGDLADTLFKAHVRNQRIIDEYIAARRAA